tara:strand:- start:40 stop:990 length:951 start_codon:yes stop_codon:yes gene_type:complete
LIFFPELSGDMNDKEKFIKKYIQEINDSNFGKLYKDKIEGVFKNETNFKNYMKEKINNEYHQYEDKIFKEWKDLGFVKKRNKEIAIKYNFYKNDLIKKFNRTIKDKFLEFYDANNIEESIKGFFKKNKEEVEELGYRIVKNEIEKVFKNSLHFILQGGFPENINQINEGTQTSNSGDSHQFKFISRAILAGYTASNVDVRTSGYDCIIDYDDKLYKIQVKGRVSTTNIISFKGRARGGQGIDHKHITNQAVRITNKDCDIYASVDKGTGICYLIPMKWVDEKIPPNKSDEHNDNIHLDKLKEFKENWNVFEEKKYF